MCPEVGESVETRGGEIERISCSLLDLGSMATGTRVLRARSLALALATPRRARGTSSSSSLSSSLLDSHPLGAFPFRLLMGLTGEDGERAEEGESIERGCWVWGVEWEEGTDGVGVAGRRARAGRVLE